jgi:hypothetical protein
MDLYTKPEEQIEPLDLYSIPSIEQATKTTNDDMVYTSIFSGKPSIIDEFKEIKNEVNRTGSSTKVQDQISLWKKEQKINREKDIVSIISDNSIPVAQRREIATKYLTEGVGVYSLRDKFLLKASSADIAMSEADREAQDIYSESVFKRDLEKKGVSAIKETVKANTSFWSEVLDIATNQQIELAKGDKVIGQTFGALTSQIGLSIPAGYLAAYNYAVEKDPEKAAEIVQVIAGAAIGDVEPDTAEVLKRVESILTTIDIPFKWIADQDFDTTGSPLSAALTYTAAQAIGIAGLFKIGTKTIGSVKNSTDRVKESVPDGSVLATAQIANKEMAADIATEAIKDNTGIVEEGLKTTKAAIINDQVLPKLDVEYGEIHPDTRVKIEAQDEILSKLYDDTELHPFIAPVTQIRNERDLYVKILTETTNSHLLLSSSVIGTPSTAFGRSGKGKEARIDVSYDKLEGVAVYGRNPYHGYKTEKGAQAYLERLKEQTEGLPHVEEGRPDLSILERDGQYYVQMKFTRPYNQWESISFGEDAIGAHLFSRNIDITKMANSPVGSAFWPSYMRIATWIPSVGATTAWKEARIEGKFINAQRDLFMGTDHPKELSTMVLKGEEEGKVYTANDFQTINQHLSKEQNSKLHAEYVGYRRIQDHLYNFSDRAYRKDLQKSGYKVLYDKQGEKLGFSTEPIENLTGVARVWDIENKKMESFSADQRIVKLKDPVRVGDDILEYATITPYHQFGDPGVGSLTKIPGYVARYYKEWFVLEKTPTSQWVNGVKVPANELRGFKQAVAMGGTRSEINALLERFKQEDPSGNYEIRKEKKNVEDSIIHDSKVYETYLKEHHRRGGKLPSLNREATTEDVLVAQTKAIKGVAKITAWGDLSEVFQKQFIKEYAMFLPEKRFPGQINEIVAPRGKPLTEAEELKYLAAQKVYQQWEMQQVSSLPSDEMWRSTLNGIADVYEKMEVDGSVLREWGEKGFVPVRAMKALGSNLFLYIKPMRMWFLQPQQFKELSLLSPSFATHLHEIPSIMLGLLSRSGPMAQFKSQVDFMGRRTLKDYDEVLEALEGTGILQSVDMNQMIHGIWRDSLKELDQTGHSIWTKSADTATGVVGAVFKLGRRIGYDPAELTNQVSLWLFARQRWIDQNPGKNWNTPENKEAIAQLQVRMGHIASTRAGMFGWQEGNISLFTQFIAIPHKSTLQMVSSKDLTGGEKAKLAAARLFWYGKYGLPAGAAVYSILERNVEDEEDKKKINAWSDGVTDLVWDTALGMMFDSDVENTNTAVSKSFTTVQDQIIFWDLANDLLNMANGQPTANEKFPFVTAGSSLFTMVRDVWDMFRISDTLGEEVDPKAILWKAVSFAGQLSDYSKAQLLTQTTKSGSSLGFEQTKGEAFARLFGVAPEREIAAWDFSKLDRNRDKAIESDAKQIHQRLYNYVKTKEDLTQREANELYLSGLKHFLVSVDEGYRDELTNAILKQDKNMHKTLKDSIMRSLYDKAKIGHDSARTDMENTAAKIDDPDIQNLLRDIRNLRERNSK